MTEETIARPKKRKPTPPDALTAFDVVTKAGFATLEQGLHVIDHQLKHDPFAEHRTVREWIEAIRKHAGTDWFSIEKRSLPWRGGWCAGYVDRPSIGRPQAGWHVIFWDPCGEDRERAAWLGAYYLLRAEKRCRARDIDRAHRLLRQGSQSLIPARFRAWSRTSAFDWYVMLLVTLSQDMGVKVDGFEVDEELVKRRRGGLHG